MLATVARRRRGRERMSGLARSAMYTGPARRTRGRASAPTSSRWSSGTCSPRGGAASFVGGRQSRARPPPGLTGHNGRRSHRPNRRDHRTPRQPHPPRHRDRERRARPKTTGTIARMLSLRLDDAQAGGSSASARRSGAVVYSSARDALVPQGESSSALAPDAPVRSSIPRPVTRSSPRAKAAAP